jgi:formate dehydrogenase assembly factor FdhD
MVASLIQAAEERSLRFAPVSCGACRASSAERVYNHANDDEADPQQLDRQERRALRDLMRSARQLALKIE